MTMSLLESVAAGTTGGEGRGIRRPHFGVGHGLFSVGHGNFELEDGELLRVRVSATGAHAVLIRDAPDSARLGS